MQAALFTPDEEVSAAKLLQGLAPTWAKRFDGEPMVVPSQLGLPPEVPKLILHSRDQSWRCEIASARINIHWLKSQESTPRIGLDRFYDEAVALLHQYRGFLRARVGRLAAVITRFAYHASPGPFLARHFCQERWLVAPFNRPESFELHAHKKFPMADFTVNSWVRSKTGLLGSKGEQRPIVLVEQDLNTLGEETETRDFSEGEINAFFRASVGELDTILNLYYPLGDRA
jgi:hypothetical protein